jgi:hypothetical protein
MSFISECWENAKAIGKGILDVFATIGEVLITAIFAIGYVIFEIVKHLYEWIDSIADKLQGNGDVVMVPPKDTEEFIQNLRERGKTTLPPYKPGTKRTLLVGSDSNGKVKVGQVASTEKGFEKPIQDAFDKGNLVEQPIG